MDGTWPIYRLFIAYVSRHCDFPSHSIATCCSKLAEGVYRSSRWFVVFLRLKILQILKSVADMWKRRWWSTNLSQRSKLIQLPFFRSLIWCGMKEHGGPWRWNWDRCNWMCMTTALVGGVSCHRWAHRESPKVSFMAHLWDLQWGCSIRTWIKRGLEYPPKNWMVWYVQTFYHIWPHFDPPHDIPWPFSEQVTWCCGPSEVDFCAAPWNGPSCCAAATGWHWSVEQAMVSAIRKVGWRFPEMGDSQNGWFVMENLMNMIYRMGAPSCVC